MTNRYATEVVRDIGVRMDYKGYDYIVSGVRLLMIEPHKPVSRVYEEVAEEFGCTWKGVERCIRHCIHELLANGDLDKIWYYFGSSYRSHGVITNKQFLYTLARHAVDRSKEE